MIKPKHFTKQILIASLLLAYSLSNFAQVSISHEGFESHPSAILELISTDKGLLIPRMSTSERDNMEDVLDSDAESLLIYNKEKKCIETYVGGEWHEFWCYDPCKGVDAPEGFGIVASSGSCWLDRNLGASQVAESFDDYNAYGGLFQWGRLDDNHQFIEWNGSDSYESKSGERSDLATEDNPGHNDFITTGEPPLDWREGHNDNLWQVDNGSILNNPCPDGWRVPTIDEWNDEMDSWNSDDRYGAYESPLKLTVAGFRQTLGPISSYVGDWGNYWSSTTDDVDNAKANFICFTSNFSFPDSNWRGLGYSVRCIKE